MSALSQTAPLLVTVQLIDQPTALEETWSIRATMYSHPLAVQIYLKPQFIASHLKY